MESPYHAGNLKKLTEHREFFNWTMTYRRDSDINLPYFIVVKKKEPMKELDWRKVSFVKMKTNFSLSQEVSKMISSKNKTAAWFVSNCQTVSKREVYVKRMQEHIDVDVYGSCGNFQCSRERGGKYCDAMLQKQYWCVLSAFIIYIILFDSNLSIFLQIEKLF
jgi:alpha-1,3-fucosyltransferase